MPPDSVVTLVPWAACVIEFKIEGIAFIDIQDGSFDESATVTNGVGDVTIQLMPGRGIDHRLCRTTFMQRHINGTEGWCTVEHVDDERKRIRIYNNAGEAYNSISEIGFDKYTAHRNV